MILQAILVENICGGRLREQICLKLLFIAFHITHCIASGKMSAHCESVFGFSHSVDVRDEATQEPSVIVSVCDFKTPRDTWHVACAENLV